MKLINFFSKQYFKKGLTIRMVKIREEIFIYFNSHHQMSGGLINYLLAISIILPAIYTTFNAAATTAVNHFDLLF